ncbi:MAG: glycosyltransferase [Oscillospiraceae bacterium]
MKRILHVVSCLERGGTEAFIMNQYRAIDRSNYQFDFLVFHEKGYPYTDEIHQLGGKVFFCTPPSKWNIFSSVQEMVQCMKRNGPYAAVHSHINVENAWVMVAAELAGVRVRVSHSHDTKGKEGNLPTRLYRSFQCLLIRQLATRYAACGTAAGNYLYGKRLFKRKGCVIHNGIDVERFLDVPQSKILKLKEEFTLTETNYPVFGNITRFEDKKNQLFAVDVFREITQVYPNAVFLLGGPDGGNLEQVKQKVEDLGLKEHVRFIGERSDIPACLKLIDIYLFPSLYEGLPIALLEAQAAGCFCVVSTNVSNESDIGVGQVFFCDLQETPAHWADMIRENASFRKRPSPEVISAVFREKGYDIRWPSNCLAALYEP